MRRVPGTGVTFSLLGEISDRPLPSIWGVYKRRAFRVGPAMRGDAAHKKAKGVEAPLEVSRLLKSEVFDHLQRETMGLQNVGLRLDIDVHQQ